MTSRDPGALSPRPRPRARWLAPLALAAGVALATPAAAQSGPQECEPLPPALAERVEQGWRHYRAGRNAAADSAFAIVNATCPGDHGATVGRAYTRLRLNDVTAADSLLDLALTRRPDDYDALVGRGLLDWRRGDVAAARRSFERALRVAPKSEEVRQYLATLPRAVDSTALPARGRPARTVIGARAGDRVLEVPDGRGGWRPLWIKAVNIGAALPGRHPSEFPPNDSTYDRWLALAAEMGANAVRVYTIHPPHFYAALARWNRAHPDRPLWLLHGVWAELPPGEEEHRYDDPAWSSEFREEMRRVVDLLHGNAAIQPRPGHAYGLYTADVSPWVLGYIIGREWEPYSVSAYVRENPAVTGYRGRFVSAEGGNAMDAWLAAASDYLVSYEMDRYNAQRPIAYTNWPTLDPLHHPTEATAREEDALRRRLGERIAERPREFDNDGIGLDATLMRATPAYPAGVFASYHAYPYYPDFMVLDPGYARARSPEGPSAYYGYLRELVAHHGRMPVVISEYGVPSSRGNAHFQPQGWNHGGHGEREQAEINARLTRDIHHAGAAGAVLFALIDEWFKKNWLVVDFEVPLDRNRLWLNVLDPEQHYGVIAMRAGHRDSVVTIDGDLREWAGHAPILTGDAADDPHAVRSLRARWDEAYLYLALEVGRVDWSKRRYLVGIDTYDRGRGDVVLPRTRARSPLGLEFVLDLVGPAESRLLVDDVYDPYRWMPVAGATPPDSQQVYRPPFQTRANDNGRWDSLFVVTNRRRFGRDGTIYPQRGYDRNRLLHARSAEHSLADWYADEAAGTIEVRIPWGMLHVTDPSSRQVLFGDAATGEIASRTTDGFRFVVQAYDPARPRRAAPPAPRGGTATWSWPTWEQPRWHAEVKPLFEAMRRAFEELPEHGGGAKAAAPASPGRPSR